MELKPMIIAILRPSQVISAFFSLAILVFQARLSSGQLESNRVRHWCQVTPGTGPPAGLDSLLFFLSSNASQSSNNGFYATNYTVPSSSGSDVVYGAFLCRGDDSVADCFACVGAATGHLPLQPCPQAPGAVIWCDKCMLRYDVDPFLGIVQNFSSTQFVLTNNKSISSVSSDVAAAMDLVVGTLEGLATQFAGYYVEDRYEKGNRKYYGTKEVMFNGRVTLYTMAQCTPDLDSDSCKRCLSLLIDKIPTFTKGSEGAHIMHPSCDVRYDTYKFYKDQTPSVSPGPSSPAAGISHDKSSSMKNTFILVILVFILCITILALVAWFVIDRRAAKKKATDFAVQMTRLCQAAQNHDVDTSDLPRYSMDVLCQVTSNFSIRIGSGGFGVVYKGTLRNGSHIAVKKIMARNDEHNDEQIKNEMRAVARVQHRNLVKLLGICTEEHQKLLIFEYVMKGSLDRFLSQDADTRRELNWPTRLKIIKGVAKGLYYLHMDSRPKIIHCDLKPGNILLDEEMNPKIADFGLAKVFRLNQTQEDNNANGEGASRTTNVRQNQTAQSRGRGFGTPGYAAPEQVSTGQCSEKSDIYSFGVIVLEIICGQTISKFHEESSDSCNLLAYASKLWKAGRALELMDSTIKDSCSDQDLDKVKTCIQLGLLCIDKHPDKRISIRRVVNTLSDSSEGVLNEPRSNGPATSEQQLNNQSRNEASVTEVYPR